MNIPAYTQTLRLSAKPSTSALPTDGVGWPNTLSFAQTEPSSAKNISSATGGSTSTVQKLRTFTGT